MRPPLSKRQSEYLAFIEKFRKRAGYPPSFRELGAKFGGVSKNAVACVLAGLERKGYISRERYVARGIRVLP